MTFKERSKEALPISVVWEGSQFVYHSLALENREVSLQLADTDGIELSIKPYEPHQFTADVDPRFYMIEERINRPLSKPADIHVRHQWPPGFEPPEEGKWVIMQPWEYGRIPREWVAPMRDKVDEIWVCSNYVKDCFQRSGVPEEKIKCFHLGVDSRIFRPDLQAMDLPTDKGFRFLFVGGSIYRKGIDLLLQAYATAFTARDDVCLVIKDMGGQSFYKGQTADQIINKLKSMPNAPEILHLAHDFPAEELGGLYRACHALVHPFRGEGFGLPMLEAMACGLPLIVSAYGPILEFCHGGIAAFVGGMEVEGDDCRMGDLELTGPPILFEPDLEELIHQMRRYYRNRDQARVQGLRGAAKAKEELSWEKTTKKIVRRIRALAGREAEPLISIEEGEELVKSGRLEEAVQLFKILLQGDPENYTALNDLACIQWEQGETQEAVKHLYRAMKIKPDDRDTVWNLGQFLLSLGKAGDALELYKVYLSEHPEEKEMEEILCGLAHGAAVDQGRAR